MNSKCEHCIIKQFSALRTLSKEELMKMSECKSSQVIKKGEIIFEEGERLDGVYCIRSGICKLTKLSANGKNQIVKFVKKGDLLGQRSIISDEATNLSAYAVNDMEVCMIPKSEILAAFHSNPDFSTQVIKDVCHDLKLSDIATVNMAQKPVKERLAQFLLDFSNEFGTDEDGFLSVQLSREEISNVVGTANESIIRMLSEFSKLGLIVTSGKKIKVSDPRALERMAEGMV